jgi:hypothetical protein
LGKATKIGYILLRIHLLGIVLTKHLRNLAEYRHVAFVERRHLLNIGLKHTWLAS